MRARCFVEKKTHLLEREGGGTGHLCVALINAAGVGSLLGVSVDRFVLFRRRTSRVRLDSLPFVTYFASEFLTRYRDARTMPIRSLPRQTQTQNRSSTTTRSFFRPFSLFFLPHLCIRDSRLVRLASHTLSPTSPRRRSMPHISWYRKEFTGRKLGFNVLYVSHILYRALCVYFVSLRGSKADLIDCRQVLSRSYRPLCVRLVQAGEYS